MHLASKPVGSSKLILATLAFIVISLVLLLQSPVRRGSVAHSLYTSNLHGTSKYTSTIPNIVHFVHLVEADLPASFEFLFRQFVAIYSAWHYLMPEAIYIHTNVEQQLVKGAINNAVSPYTQAIARLPGLEFRYHDAINKTTKGLKVNKLPNKSDFVRTDVLERHGGVYLDDDAYVLRDLAPLRELKYENIIGRQGNGEICPAVMLAAPHNKMITAYRDLQDQVFDGEWATHATALLTSLALEFQMPDHQVLILAQDAFFPLGWGRPELETIYGAKQKAGRVPSVNQPTENITDFITNFKLHGPNTWKKDWRLSYVLHGWNSGLEGGFSEKEYGKLFGQDWGITLEYVLARKSNFALAVYPAVRHALDNGVLDHVRNGSLTFGRIIKHEDE